jgi:hypothetical protein
MVVMCQEKIKTAMEVFLLGIFFVGCAQNAFVTGKSEVIYYRGALDPLGSIASTIGNGNLLPSYHQCYISWRVEHDNIVSSIGQGRLAILEAHRRATGHLQAMSYYLKIEKKRKLENYIRLYRDLLVEIELETPKRVMVRKYALLKETIVTLLGG